LLLDPDDRRESLELVPKGLAVLSNSVEALADADEKGSDIIEPLVISAELSCASSSFCDDLVKPLLESFSSVTSSPQHRGKFLEYSVSVRMLARPKGLHEAQGVERSQWPAAADRYAGILVNVPLNDTRGIVAAIFHEEVSYIIIPENSAGPDVVAYPFFFLKSTTGNAVKAEQSRRSADRLCSYTVKNGTKEPTVQRYIDSQ
jgi:hypothetical protein